jgi:hypothetical protein
MAAAPTATERFIKVLREMLFISNLLKQISNKFNSTGYYIKLKGWSRFSSGSDTGPLTRCDSYTAIIISSAHRFHGEQGASKNDQRQVHQTYT